MQFFKCKMCGGDIIVNENQTYGTCDSCGSTMTLPKIDDERRANAFNRANHLRRQNDFDKAISAYERILNEDNTDAEAHWGIVLSRYGIEYVEDPKTHERIPTCHRVQTNSILADSDYLGALEHAPDGHTRSLYEEEAKRIFGIQKEILSISNREEPYDVFICYKETSESGTRTKDSAIAQDVYYQLTNEGYKVFFSRITLEDKLGQQYEPYIFAALNSAKVMMVIGTKRENYEAVWVKNEWLRFLDLMKKDRSRLLIPCYYDMDAYDLPEELSMLQSQDMSKIGFIQDLIRGVKKVVEAGKKPLDQTASKSAEAVVTPSVISLYERGKIILEDKDWKSASEYFDRVLDIDPKFAPAYVGKLCVHTQKISEADLVRNFKPLTEYGDYLKAIRFADSNYQETLKAYNQAILDRIEYERKENIYQRALAFMLNAINEENSSSKRTWNKLELFAQAKELFDDVKLHKESITKSKECEKHIAELRLEAERLTEHERLEEERKRTERERERFEKLRRKRKKRLITIASIVSAMIIIAITVACLKDLILKEDLRSISKAAVGDIVSFGSYEQDNYSFNGKEKIFWRVLDKSDTSAILISNMCLDCMPYEANMTRSNWETCSLREWLNGTFVKVAFNSRERGQIIPTDTEGKINLSQGHEIDTTSTDKVFILNKYELELYLSDEEARRAEPSMYAKDQGELAVSGYNYSPWWLRGASGANSRGIVVSEMGAVIDGIMVNSSRMGVRPVIVVSLQ